jgi:hypothetical protein
MIQTLAENAVLRLPAIIERSNYEVQTAKKSKVLMDFMVETITNAVNILGKD